MAQLVDAWRRNQVDLPTRAEAIRRLAAMALNASGVAEKDEKPPGKGTSGNARLNRVLAVRLAEARAELVKLGADAAEKPVAAVVADGRYPLTGRRPSPAVWLAIAAPASLAFGFAPLPRKEGEPKTKRKRRKAKPAPRKPAAPVKAKGQPPPMKLVAANQN